MEIKNKNLVIGAGEIGKAIMGILECPAHDPEKGYSFTESVEVIHICFPYSDNFVENIHHYRFVFDAKLIVIHSTVPVGTTASVGPDAVHSPCRGVHPHLDEGIRTFVKYFGGPKAIEAVKLFPMLKWVYIKSSQTTELLKLVDTTLYGINILAEKEIKRLCEVEGADFDVVYTDANRTYNEGYENLGMPQFKKYVLEHQPGKIGGHCVVPNAHLFDSWMCDLIKSQSK